MKKLISMLLIMSVLVCSLTFIPARYALGQPVAYDLNDVAYSGMAYVTVGDYGTIRASADGENWIMCPPITVENLKGVTFDGTRFLAVGTNGTLLMSPPQGMGWIPLPTGVTNNLNAIIYSGSQYVVVGEQGFIMTSPDCINWSVQNSLSTADLFDVIYNNGKFVAVGDYSTVLTSTDGITWIKNAFPSVQAVSLNNIIWDGYQFVVVGSCGTVATSPDGIVWNLKPSPDTSADLKGITWTGTEYITIGSYCALFTTFDLTNWTPKTKAFPEVDYRAILWCGTKYVMVGTYTTIIAGEDAYCLWRVCSEPVITEHLYDVVWSAQKNLFVTVGTRGIIEYSYDGYNWYPAMNYTRVSEHLYGVTWSQGLGMFMAVGDKGVVLYSYDGYGNWYTGTRPTTRKLNSVTCPLVKDAQGNVISKFLAVGDYGKICETSDAINWTLPVSPVSTHLNSTTFNQIDTTTIVGDGGVLLSARTYQIVSWKRIPLPTNARLQDINYDSVDLIWPSVGWNKILTIPYGYVNPQISSVSHMLNGVTSNWNPGTSQYLAVGNRGAMMNSFDGYTWSSLAPLTSNNLNDVTYSYQLNLFVGVGNFLTKVQY